MEGGVLIESSAQNSNYYCYMCAEEVRPIFPEIKCPICLNGFIELVAEYNLDENQVNTDLEGVNPVANPRSGVFGGIGIYHGFLEPSRDEMGDILAEALQSELLPLQSGAALPFTAEHFLRDLRVYPTDMHTTSGQSADPDAQRNASNIVWDMMQLYLEFNQSSDVVDSFEWDALITQLLNETDYSVSQPLSKEKIEEIPLISLEEQHVEKSFQCAICMEDFNVKDLAKVLPCQHFYHEVCIIPWFETHSTCPVCRQSLDSGSVDDEETDGPTSSISEGSNFAVTHGNSGVSHQSSVPGNLDADLALLSLEPRHSS